MSDLSRSSCYESERRTKTPISTSVPLSRSRKTSTPVCKNWASMKLAFVSVIILFPRLLEKLFQNDCVVVLFVLGGVQQHDGLFLGCFQ